MLKATAQPTRRSKVGAVGVSLGLLIAGVVGAVRAANGWNPVVAAVEGFVLDDLAVVAVVSAPALLAWLASRGRPILFLPAGITSALLSFGSFSLLTLPLLVPAVLYFIAFGRSHEPSSPHRFRLSGAAAAGGLFVIAAALTFFIGSSLTVCWTKVTYRDGTIVWARDVSAERTEGRAMRSGALGPREVESEGGCNGGTLPAPASVGVLALAGAALVLGRTIPRDQAS